MVGSVKPATPVKSRKPVPVEPPMITDEDQQYSVLLSACREGPRRFSCLRKDFGLMPEDISKVLEIHPNVFVITSRFGFPHCELLPGMGKETSNERFEPVFVSSKQKAAKQPGAVNPGASKIAPGLIDARDKLVPLLTHIRNSDWLLEVHSLTLETIREINLTWPDLIDIEVQSVWAGNTRFNISLKGQDKQAEPEPVIAQPKPAPDDGPHLTAKDWQDMMWKPNRTAAFHRGRTVAQDLRNRPRNPHPDFKNL